MSRNIKEKVISSLVFEDLRRQLNDNLARGWQLEGKIETLPMEVPGAETNMITLFMGPILPTRLAYLKNGYVAKISIDVDQWRQKQIFELNAQEDQFLKQRLQTFRDSAPFATTVATLWQKFQGIGINTVDELFKALPPIGKHETNANMPAVRCVSDYAVQCHAATKSLRKRQAESRGMTKRWFEDFDRFQAYVRDRLSRFASDRAAVATKEPH